LNTTLVWYREQVFDAALLALEIAGIPKIQDVRIILVMLLVSIAGSRFGKRFVRGLH
jgi:hypothetical protein